MYKTFYTSEHGVYHCNVCRKYPPSEGEKFKIDCRSEIQRAMNEIDFDISKKNDEIFLMKILVEKKKICENAINIIKEHILHEHPKYGYDCSTCDRKFIRKIDVIKKNHNCSYKKTKLKKYLGNLLNKDVSTIILDFLE